MPKPTVFGSASMYSPCGHRKLMTAHALPGAEVEGRLVVVTEVVVSDAALLNGDLRAQPKREIRM